jgi:hypothetical protein
VRRKDLPDVAQAVSDGKRSASACAEPELAADQGAGAPDAPNVFGRLDVSKLRAIGSEASRSSAHPIVAPAPLVTSFKDNSRPFPATS